MVRREQIPALTGVRFLAAFAVLLFHFAWVIPYPLPLGQLIYHGTLGVDLFFVLSGFVMVYSYGDALSAGAVSYREFLQARFARIVPMHVLALLLLTPIVLYGLAAGAPKFSVPTVDVVGSWLATLFLVFPLDPHSETYLWNVPAWSLSAEVLFYLLFPLLVRLGLARLSRRLPILGTGVAILLAYLLILRLIPPVRVWQDAYFLPPLRLPEFLIGCLAARYYLNCPPSARTTNALLVGASPLAAFVVLWPTGWEPTFTVLYAPLAALLIVGLARKANPLSRLLAHPIALQLGEASYALYLLQYVPLSLLILLGGQFFSNAPMPWLQAAARQHPGNGVPPLVSLLVIAATIGGALLAYHFVECPARRALRPRLALRARPEQTAEIIA